MKRSRQVARLYDGRWLHLHLVELASCIRDTVNHPPAIQQQLLLLLRLLRLVLVQLLRLLLMLVEALEVAFMGGHVRTISKTNSSGRGGGGSGGGGGKLRETAGNCRKLRETGNRIGKCAVKCGKLR